MLSVIIITKNEEHNIRECLESVQWATEIVLVDHQSTDRTVEIAQAFTDKIFVRPWKGYGPAKNFALSQCSCQWVLSLDADERISPPLQSEILAVLTNPLPHTVAFSMPRRANFLGRWIDHSNWYPGRITRLFRKSVGRFTEKRVHEGVSITGTVTPLRNDILHYTDPDLEHYFIKFNHYTSLASQEMAEKNRPFSLYKLIMHPLWKFVNMYFFKQGFRDGIQGFILCVVSAGSVYIKYAKLWELTVLHHHDKQSIYETVTSKEMATP